MPASAQPFAVVGEKFLKQQRLHVETAELMEIVGILHFSPEPVLCLSKQCRRFNDTRVYNELDEPTAGLIGPHRQERER